MECSFRETPKTRREGCVLPEQIGNAFFGAGDAAACAGYAFLTPPRRSTLSGALCLSV
jgi:hypothetical protein